MGAVMVDGRDSPAIDSAEEMAGRFASELMTLMAGWKQRLRSDPGALELLERDVHKAFARGADLVVAGLVAVTMKQPAFEAASEQTRRGFAQPLTPGRERTIGVKLLGGLLIWVASLYCEPRKSARSSEEKVSGLYVELAQFGCGKGVTPGLESRVARQAALCPSLELARQELERDGVKLDVKTVRRITYQLGNGLLRLRKQQLLLWRAGQLPAGDELHGKRVSVQIDGGRTKLRGDLRPSTAEQESTEMAEGKPEDAPGRSKKRPAQTFDAEWREPKLVTIFVHDERGRMVKQSQATFEGTFLGPDAVAELVAMHLHRLGAAKALSITFASDGAPWIWHRIPRIITLLELRNVPTYQVLDCCHAIHHISLALAASGLCDEKRTALYRRHRTLLRNGQWRGVVQELRELSDDSKSEKIKTEIAYLQKHGEAGRLSYPHFRKLGLPLGSGAIESGIRRVINLRLKSNAIFWREPNAESMLQVRAQVISNRWDQRVQEVRELRRQDGRIDWTWHPQPMSAKTEAENANTA
jgi:hypothetical protein